MNERNDYVRIDIKYDLKLHYFMYSVSSNFEQLNVFENLQRLLR